jgi:hypothetical protein
MSTIDKKAILFKLNSMSLDEVQMARSFIQTDSMPVDDKEFYLRAIDARIGDIHHVESSLSSAMIEYSSVTLDELQ